MRAAGGDEEVSNGGVRVRQRRERMRAGPKMSQLKKKKTKLNKRKRNLMTPPEQDVENQPSKKQRLQAVARGGRIEESVKQTMANVLKHCGWKARDGHMRQTVSDLIDELNEVCARQVPERFANDDESNCAAKQTCVNDFRSPTHVATSPTTQKDVTGVIHWHAEADPHAKNTSTRISSSSMTFLGGVPGHDLAVKARKLEMEYFGKTGYIHQIVA